MPSNNSYSEILGEHIALFNSLQQMKPIVAEAADLIAKTLRDGKKVLACGNGGSAADAQHFAAELVGRFENDRKALPAIALTTDTSIITSVANDYSYEKVFSRQVEGLAARGDMLVGISTSGNSKNVMLAIEAAKVLGVKTIGLLGRDGGAIASLVDIPVVVPHPVTARIQEAHIFIIHYWCSVVEQNLLASTGKS